MNQTRFLVDRTPFFLGSRLKLGLHAHFTPSSARILNDGSLRGLRREALFKLVRKVPADISAWCAGLDPDIVHAHFGQDGALVLPLAKSLGKPLVVSFHGTDATATLSSKSKALNDRLFRRRVDELRACTTLFIAASEYVRDSLLAHGFPAERIRVHYHGVDIAKWRRQHEPRASRQVLFVGRLIERKGLAHLIEALAGLVADVPDVTLKVIGGGPDRPRLEALAQSRLGTRATFLGTQPDEILVRELHSSRVFCMPSLTMKTGEAETFGVVFAEAQAAGVPVVAYASGGIPEAVQHGTGGLLAPEGDIKALGEYLRTLLTDDGAVRLMGERGRAFVSEHFDVKRQSIGLERLHDEAVRLGPRWRV